MNPRPQPVVRYWLLALDRPVDHPETVPPGIGGFNHLSHTLRAAASYRELGRKFVIWDVAMGVALQPSGDAWA